MNPVTQAKVLRVLENRTIERLGGTQSIPVVCGLSVRRTAICWRRFAMRSFERTCLPAARG